MSDANQTRIEELEKTVAALCDRVEHLEKLLMIRDEKPATRLASNLPSRLDAPLYTPPCARFRAPIQKPAPIERPAPAKALAPTERAAPPQRPVAGKTEAPAQTTAAPTKKAAPTQPNPTPSQPTSILFDANIPTAKPHQPKPEHLKYIQRLHRDGHSKDVIAHHAFVTYPDLHKGQGKGTVEARTAFVLSTVEIYTSRWAERYI
ncbi:hypothetical protein MMC22_004810 [Lobaria immixta]|nr:hypothetical protein [Lobaria immixta]